jgi:hypothetical protein
VIRAAAEVARQAGCGERGRDVYAAQETAMPVLWKVVLA